MKLEVEKWLGARDGYFAAAMREIALREHPSIYGKPPGVHELEVWKIEAYQRGHTLEAIAASKRDTTLNAAEIEPTTTILNSREQRLHVLSHCALEVTGGHDGTPSDSQRGQFHPSTNCMQIALRGLQETEHGCRIVTQALRSPQVRQDGVDCLDVLALGLRCEDMQPLVKSGR
jgi:hypothetical protein